MAFWRQKIFNCKSAAFFRYFISDYDCRIVDVKCHDLKNPLKKLITTGFKLFVEVILLRYFIVSNIIIFLTAISEVAVVINLFNGRLEVFF